MEIDPKLSIIMATYNRAHYIIESLESIKNQNFTNWECLIIDDGSKDKTAEVVSNFTANDLRFKYYKRNKGYKKGLPGCRNFGLDIAKGKFIVFFDDDDIVHPGLLEITVSELGNSEQDFCRYLRSAFSGKFTYNFKTISEYNIKFLNPSHLGAIIKNEIPFNSCQVVWRKTSIGNKRFEESLMFAEEWEFYTRLVSEGLKGVSVDKVLYFGRKHLNSNTGKFYEKNPDKIDSKIRASVLIIQNLASKQLFSPALKNYFLRLGFQLDSKKIIELVLNYSGAGPLEKIKYKLGYFAYPVLRPLFILKGKLLSRQNFHYPFSFSTIP